VGEMRLKRALGIFIGLIILFSFFMTTPLTADNTIDCWVDTNFEIEFETGNELNVIITMNVHKLTTDKTYSAEEIRCATEGERGALKYELYLMLKNQLNIIFANEEMPDFSMPVYSSKNTIGTPGEIAYDPPAIFEEDLNISLSSLFFNLSETVNAGDIINGVLDMNAIISYDFDLKAEPGWKNTYTVVLPSPMVYRSTNGQVNGDRISWLIDNKEGGTSDIEAKLSVQLANPTTKPNNESIDIEFKLDNIDVKKPSLIINVLTKTIKLSGYDFLPSFITNLNYLSSDGIRLFVNNNFISWEDVYQNTIKAIKEKAVSKIQNSSFNQTLDIIFSWDTETTSNCSTPYNTTHMDDDPPVKAKFMDNLINLKICGISSRTVFGLSNIGAIANISSSDINFGDKLNDMGYPYTGFLILPNNITLAEENIYMWNSSKTISGNIETTGATKYSNEEIESIVQIEIDSTDLNLFSFFAGKAELLLGLYLEEEQNCNVITLPSEFYLPKKISINYLNSDAIRLCIEENVFTSNNITAFLNNKKNIFNNRLSGILSGLKVDGRSDRGKFDSSLAWDEDISKMDSETPVKVVSYAHSSYPNTFGVSFSPIGFDFSDMNFNFVGQENQKVKYRIVFPKGLSSVEYDDQLDRAVLGKTDDDRYYLEVAFDTNESGVSTNLTCKMIPSPLMMLSIFMPCILSLFIFIILVVVIIVVRKKRKFGGGKKPKVRKEPDEELEGYEEQDYYVPPPPPSSK